jgi:hypothetical protein
VQVYRNSSSPLPPPPAARGLPPPFISEGEVVYSHTAWL